MFMKYNFYPLTLNLFLYLYLKCVSFKQHIVVSFFFLATLGSMQVS